MGYNRAIKTDAGNELLSRAIAGETTITFTKIATSENGISEFEIKQEISASVTKFEKESKVGVILDTIFSNATLTTGYDINVIGIYAKDSNNNEIMFSYLENDGTPIPMEAFNGEVPQSVHIQVEAGIWLDDGSLIVIDQSGIATIEYVDNKIEIIENKLNSAISFTIPADTGSNYTTLTDKDGVDYYYIDIPVAGIIADYNGLKPVEPVLPDPSDSTNFSLADNESIVNDYFSLIIDGGVRSYNGYVRVFMYDLPDTAFDVYLYGV